MIQAIERLGSVLNIEKGFHRLCYKFSADCVAQWVNLVPTLESDYSERDSVSHF